MNIQALIFDLDGTLLDTLQDIAISANLALAQCGRAQHDIEAYRTFVGNGMEMLFRRALAAEAAAKGIAPFTNDIVHAALERMQATYAEHGNDTTAAYAGIMDMLHELKARGIPLAILSNKPHPFTLQVVAEHFSADLFAMVAGANPHVPHKPDPSAALAMAKSWGLAPESVAFVGDSDVDMKTARAAGMLAVGCPWGFRGAAELQAAGADIVLESPSALLKLFD